MFKSRRKRQQQKLAEEAEAAAAEANSKLNGPQYLLDDIKVAHDFRSSVILPQLNKDLDPNKMSRQQQHLQQLREIPESPPLSPPPHQHRLSDGTRQYQELAAWRHQRSQNRYSNGLFGGKQRGRPKPNQIKKIIKNEKGELEEIIVQEEPSAEPSLISMLQQQDLDFSDDDDEYILNPAATADLLPEESYEPDSEEENYFFQDFSATDDVRKKPVKKSTVRKRHPPATKFDLSLFARDLHEHRLSVLQPRDSRIVMTEDDELELEKLLERQRQRMSMMLANESVESLTPPPPLPSLDLFKSHQLPALVKDLSSTTTSLTLKNSLVQKVELVNEVPQVDTPAEPVYTPHVYTPPVHTPVVKPSAIKAPIEHDDLTQPTPVHATPVYTLPIKTPPVQPAQTTSTAHTTPHSQPTHTSLIHPPIRTPSTRSIQVPSRSLSTQAPTRSLSTQSRPLASVSESASVVIPKIDQIKRSISTTSIRSNTTGHTPARIAPIHDKETRHSARKSISMDNIKLGHNEPSVTSAALDWISEDSSQDPTSFLYRKATPTPAPQKQSQPVPKASRSLFGSLRQVSRSKTHAGNGVTSIKGLVRNFSSSHKPERDSGMSRAAMAVIHHNAINKKREEEPVRPTTKSDVNLISNLIARASMNKTKVVNMEDAKKKRAQVVRRTIIYVQPDSLHDMLKNNVPPVPSLGTRDTMMSDLSQDDETVKSKEYATATKIVRQTSVRKRVVDAPVLAREASGKRYQLKSVDEHDLLFNKQDKKHVSSSSSENSDYIEGVELREMSDGTVVWGLVKKQGGTSFEEEEKHGSSPPPIPKRSPRRQETNVYYSNQVTLPHLLKMMQEQHPGDAAAYELDQRAMTSVDDQLDEMMRILTSPQQQ